MDLSPSFPRLHVGTSGWTYADWVGPFYPRGLKPAERLAFYAARFDTLEINVSFYRLPSPAMIAAWNRQLPADYQLVLKGPRRITHEKRLVDCGADLEQFLQRVLPLAALKVLLWQFPPSLKKDLPRLENFLTALPTGVRHAVEFRHASWWDPSTAGVLARHNAAFVAVSLPRIPHDIWPTADWLYVRFHGLGEEAYHYDYSQAELSEWAARIAPLTSDRALYAFFNNGYDGNAPRNALLFRDLLQSACDAATPDAR